MDSARLVVVSPVHNEAGHIERVARSLARQSLRPATWIVVDDGSDDTTSELLERLQPELDFLTVLRLPAAEETRDPRAAAAVARAFNAGLALVELSEFDFVAKLDADVELPSDYFEAILGRMRIDPSLGIACGNLVEPAGTDWTRISIPRHHVDGAFKLYTRRCLLDIGGIRECLGWDTIDETYARMNGYRTRSFSDLVARHHSPSAASRGRLRGREQQGAVAWIAHYGLGWVAVRSLKVAAQRRPRIISGFAFFYGYGWAGARRVSRVDDPEFRRYVRGELRSRLLASLGPHPA
ncbi:MAG: glycosyltransferase [Thermoleophilaceae bacterium]